MALTQIKAAGIAADSIDESKIADNGIDSEHYNDGSIDHAHLADDCVDGDNIADNSVGLAHMAGGTDGVIITYDASGNPVHVGPGSDGQVLTSTGAGSPPAFETLPTSGATLSGSTDNTIVTVTGSNAMQGEANLKYDGSTLTIADVDADNVIELGYGSTGNNNAYIDFVGDTTYTDYGFRIIRKDDGANSDTQLINRGTGKLQINAQDAGVVELLQNNTTRLEVETDGDVKVNTGDLIMGTSGKGISFAATSDGGTATPDEVLKDYEEGEWTPVLKQGGNEFTHGTQQGFYTRIGNFCLCFFNYSWSGIGSASGNLTLAGFPFSAKSNSGQFYFVGRISTNGWTADSYDDLTDQLLLTGNETSAIFGYQAGTGNMLTAAEMSTNSRVWGNISYLTND